MKYNTLIKMHDYVSIHQNENNTFFLTNSENGDVFEVNDTSKVIIELCNGLNSIENIYNFLVNINDDSDNERVTKEEISNFLQILIDNDLCSIVA